MRKTASQPDAEMIVIGTSLGGMRALQIILARLPEGFTTPIAVVQHRHKDSGPALPQHLERSASIRVVDAEDRQPIEPGHLYLAPADYHLMIADGRFRLSTDATVQFSRPSVDVLFESAADEYRQHLIGVVLTGANEDGANGARAIKRRGGRVVVQRPNEAEAAQMPMAAISAVEADAILTLEEIGEYLVGCCHGVRS